MRRMLGGITALALFAGCFASVPAEARGSRANGYQDARSGVHRVHVSRSGGRYRGVYAGAWRGGGYRNVQSGYGYGYGVSAYPAVYQDDGWGSYGTGYGYGNSYGYGNRYDYGDNGWWGPMAAAAILAPIAAAVVQSDYSYASLGGYCGTPARTCQLYSSAPVGTGCSCKVPGGRARGAVE